MKQWEYLIVEIDSTNENVGQYDRRPPNKFKINGVVSHGEQWLAGNIHVELNKLGKEGWELIKIGKGNSAYYDVMYTFKKLL